MRTAESVLEYALEQIQSIDRVIANNDYDENQIAYLEGNQNAFKLLLKVFDDEVN